MNIQSITSSGARLLMTVPLSGFSGGVIGTCPDKCHGITAGNAIRYDNTVGSVSYGKYIKAQADAPANSEVVGIIESVNVAGDPLVGDDGYATIVLAGQINLADGALYDSYEHPGSTGSAGGNDVYFLSAATGGIMQNLAPTEPTNVIKPIYQVAPDSPWTGQVVNYIGYQAGGQLVAEDTQDVPVGSVREMIDGLGGSESREGWRSMGSEFNLDADLGDTHGYAYQTGGLGKISETVIRCYFKTAPTASMVNQIFKMRVDGKLKLTGKALNINVANKYVDIQFQASEYTNLETYIIDGNYFTTASGELLQLTTNSKYISFTLPKVSSNTSKKDITLVMNGKDIVKQLSYMCYCPRDLNPGDWTSSRKVALSVPEDLTIKKVTVNDTLKIENTIYQVTDLVRNIKELNDHMDTLTKRTGGSSDTFTSAYGSDK